MPYCVGRAVGEFRVPKGVRLPMGVCRVPYSVRLSMVVSCATKCEPGYECVSCAI